ncbi:hypothetical protein QYM36_018696 [Artemia franciscana]|uniref:Uncharacterized protein n=1 Tax=Artemia franciscana TaxID=6661 RepID=A0AA88H909_ARTSF|nr:hypothetical protein QYM36_018696 [Artemia franciscana]
MTNEDKMNKEPVFVSESLKTKYILEERADPDLKDEKWRKETHIAAEDLRLYTIQSLPLPSNGSNIHALDFKKKTYVTKPPLEKEAQTKKEHKPLVVPRKEQCACRNISSFLKSEPQSSLNVNPKTLKIPF